MTKPILTREELQEYKDNNRQHKMFTTIEELEKLLRSLLRESTVLFDAMKVGDASIIETASLDYCDTVDETKAFLARYDGKDGE